MWVQISLLQLELQTTFRQLQSVNSMCIWHDTNTQCRFNTTNYFWHVQVCLITLIWMDWIIQVYLCMLRHTSKKSNSYLSSFLRCSYLVIFSQFLQLSSFLRWSWFTTWYNFGHAHTCLTKSTQNDLVNLLLL